jgi:1,4-alpha-glucan branching enzyme
MPRGVGRAAVLRSYRSTMLKKKPVKKTNKTSVVFELSGLEGVEEVSVVGEFNEWQPERHPMKMRKDGTWAATVRLEKDRRYEFRYVVNGERWMADEEADALVLNPYGGQNSVVDLR